MYFKIYNLLRLLNLKMLGLLITYAIIIYQNKANVEVE